MKPGPGDFDLLDEVGGGGEGGEDRLAELSRRHLPPDGAGGKFHGGVAGEVAEAFVAAGLDRGRGGGIPGEALLPGDACDGSADERREFFLHGTTPLVDAVTMARQYNRAVTRWKGASASAREAWACQRTALVLHCSAQAQ